MDDDGLAEVALRSTSASWLLDSGRHTADHANMCCFSGASGPINVNGTKIFARATAGRQLLVYAMHLDAPEDMAMILPVPVPVGAGEDTLRFIDLSRWPGFFAALDRCFPELVALAPQARSPAPTSTLTVHTVGAFEASYVPTIADFVRLDPRFRLADRVWQALPMYHDWGFAVFRLRAGAQEVHPMAFEFPTRVPGALYFPTVHVHDGRVHRNARFAHTLYFQGPQGVEPMSEVLGRPLPAWRDKWHGGMGTLPTRELLGVPFGPDLGEIVDLGVPLIRTHRTGYEPNGDVWLAGA